MVTIKDPLGANVTVLATGMYIRDCTKLQRNHIPYTVAICIIIRKPARLSLTNIQGCLGTGDTLCKYTVGTMNFDALLALPLSCGLVHHVHLVHLWPF